MLLWAIVGIVLIGVVLLDAFETVVLPRRVAHGAWLARLVIWASWHLWSCPARGPWRRGERRETYLSFYGPSALLLLIGVWATGLIGGFALLLWGLGVPFVATGGGAGFGTTLYGSGTTFFTLGLGDVLPHTALGRLLVVLEAGIGFAFLALIIAYMPVLAQAFSQREVNVALLDARAGSPPSAAELLRRHAGVDLPGALAQVLLEGERWAAELLESHLSYPLLAFYRSQHAEQSWLAGLTMILDVAALVLVGMDGTPTRPARHGVRHGAPCRRRPQPHSGCTAAGGGAGAPVSGRPRAPAGGAGPSGGAAAAGAGGRPDAGPPAADVRALRQCVGRPVTHAAAALVAPAGGHGCLEDHGVGTSGVVRRV